MTKKTLLVAIITAWMLGSLPIMAATLSASDSRETLVTQQSLDNLSVGGVFESLKRDVKYDNGGKTKLDAFNYYGYVGYDFLEWLTLFGTLGGCQAKSTELDARADAKVKWSAGLNLKLWHFDIYDPSWMAGRCSIRALGEYSQYQSGNTDTTRLEWQDLYASVTLNYEVFVARMDDIDKYPYSLLLYVGPAFSKVDGKRETAAQNYDFSEAHNLGIAAGVDLFASHNLSIGGQLQYYFDQPTLSASVMYNF
ncbi:MAG: hypothetical protein WC381_02475 [Kiritimatiellia bacterium]|jgi:hypothetical protein